ncbi:MAG TPA: methyltransferase [Polyangiales bacterium]|nr:methyltransferase [Polyangiales bacterium]
MSFDPGSRAVLSPRDLERFSGPTLFDAIAREVCAAHCLPRKELYESWEVARRVRRHFRGGRVVDLACGHGLTAWILMILDGSSPQGVAVDQRLPPSAARLDAVLAARFPHVAARITRSDRELSAEPLHAEDVVVAVHACGALTDLVLARASAVRARVAVLPCCHDLRASDLAGLNGWLEPTLAVDVARASRLDAAGYRVRTQTIPSAITARNRLLLGEPRDPQPARARD